MDAISHLDPKPGAPAIDEMPLWLAEHQVKAFGLGSPVRAVAVLDDETEGA